MKKHISVIIFSMVLLISLFPVGAAANSAQTHWKGTDSAGVVVTDGDCPIIVKNEVLTFNIENFPKTYYRSEEDFNSYSSSVTAQYTFYNPSEYTVTARLLFPFGERPMYAYQYYDENAGEYISVDDTAKYEITLNGEPLEKTLRYTLDRGAFNIDEDVIKIKDGYTDDSFYYPEMPVKCYTFEVSGIDEEEYHAATAAFDLGEFDGKTKYLLLEQSGRHTQKDGDARISAWVDNKTTLTLFVIGDTTAGYPEWTLYKNGGVEDKEKIDGTVTLIEEKDLTFSDFVFTHYDENSMISKFDWYNALVEQFNYSEDNSGVIFDIGTNLNINGSLLRWYEYEITLEPNEEAVNCVSAPLYPEIDAGYDPAVFDYIYLLSPAKTWKNFGTLDIKINTPFYLINSGNFEFTKTDGRYSLSLERLPEEELSFRLSSGEDPQRPPKKITDFLPIEIIIMLSVTAGIILVLILVIVLIRKYKKKHI
ncbi:MAG: hypothetical protein IKL10_05335 [Clostridia bacterium]|nr:hypothetical protein [Clostridia bacterium]